MGKKKKKQLGANDEVEFSRELADQDDLEAMERMDEADNRAAKRKKKKK
ncbi:YfhD family protein [Halalkalibacter urbisdiaboli]|nr:YfhD family protein [Halalkalibacter urbisdiaboli]